MEEGLDLSVWLAQLQESQQADCLSCVRGCYCDHCQLPLREPNAGRQNLLKLLVKAPCVLEEQPITSNKPSTTTSCYCVSSVTKTTIKYQPQSTRLWALVLLIATPLRAFHAVLRIKHRYYLLTPAIGSSLKKTGFMWSNNYYDASFTVRWCIVPWWREQLWLVLEIRTNRFSVNG